MALGWVAPPTRLRAQGWQARCNRGRSRTGAVRCERLIRCRSCMADLMSWTYKRPARGRERCMTPIPFRLDIPDDDIEDLKARLTRTRLPDQAPDAPWAYGTDLAYMRNLIVWWRDNFDWRAQEAKL